jgi:hypothetical protein
MTILIEAARRPIFANPENGSGQDGHRRRLRMRRGDRLIEQLREACHEREVRLGGRGAPQA